MDSPAQLGLVMGCRMWGEPPEGDAAQQTCHQGAERCLLHGSALASLGLGASQALLELRALSAWLWKSWFTTIGHWRILSPMLVLAILSAACKEVDNLLRYLALKRSVLYPSAYFYENPCLVGTLKSVSVWINL